MSPRKILGTANFLNPYGLETNGLNMNDINNLLQSAWDHGFRGIDTAAGYLNVQENLSKIKNFNCNDWKITTKIPKRNPNDNLQDYQKLIVKFIEHTRQKLSRDCINTVLVHDPITLENEKEMDLVCNTLLSEREKGNISLLGFSIYEDLSFDQMRSLEKIFNQFTLQCPYSIFDRRFEQSITEHSKFCSFQIRSIFLQGLLLDQENFKKKFKHSNAYEAYKIWLDDNNLTSLEACISFAKFSEAEELVVGFNSVRELEAFSEIFSKVKKIKPMVFCLDEQVLNPLNW